MIGSRFHHIHTVQFKLLENITNVSLRPTCYHHVQVTHLLGDYLLNPLQHPVSVSAFIKGINDDVSRMQSIKNKLKSVLEGVGGWLFLAMTIQFHQGSRDTFTSERELHNEGSDELIM